MSASESEIRGEFEKAFQEWLVIPYDSKGSGVLFPTACALWAAKWMAERCVKLCEERPHPTSTHGQFQIANEIRQLAKELS